MVDPSMVAVSRPESQVSTSAQAMIVDATFSNVSVDAVLDPLPAQLVAPVGARQRAVLVELERGLGGVGRRLPTCRPRRRRRSRRQAVAEGGLLAVVPLFAAHIPQRERRRREEDRAGQCRGSRHPCHGHMRTPGVLTDRRGRGRPGGACQRIAAGDDGRPRRRGEARRAEDLALADAPAGRPASRSAPRPPTRGRAAGPPRCPSG